VFDTGQRAGTGSAGITADEDVVCVSFRYAGGNNTDADFADEFDADAGGRVCVFQVMD
jgi:hypothetical protein